MIFFLTPIPARASVIDWPLTCSLLRQTLHSLENQSSGEFRSIVCCHDIPPFASQLDERFRFVEHPFPAPSQASSLTGENNGVRDMMLKRDVALYYAQPSESDFVMLLDADDLLHRSVVDEVNGLADTRGVLLEHGYEFCCITRRLLKRDNMVGRSGSSFLLRGDLVRPPASLAVEELEKTIYHTVWHSNVEKHLLDHKLSYQTLSECRTIYRTNTRLNHSDWYRRGRLIRTLRHRVKFLLGRKVSAEDLRDYGEF